ATLPPPPPPPQPPVQPLPVTPQNVRVTALHRRSIDFAWDASANAAGYWVYAPWPNNAEVQLAGTEYTLDNLSSGGFYCLTVIAYDTSGYSSWSSWACATLP
ncbi:MAG TPA: fibronectin type III domain-containing protein, partial [Dehalococcoidia bacterium]|nr:fibronectin type III domain-containing protein [Dehalococcoidia bacterium]